MDKNADHIDKLFHDFHGVDSGKAPKIKRQDFKPVSMSIEYAVYNEKTLESGEFQPGQVVGISATGFCFTSFLRLFPKSKITFYGKGGKRFTGVAEIVNCIKEKKDYQVQAIFSYIDIGKETPLRRFPRQTVRRSFSFQVQKGGLAYSAQLLDISKVGMRIYCRYHLKNGDLIYTNSLNKDDPATRVLRVVWARPCKDGQEVGAEFLKS